MGRLLPTLTHSACIRNNRGTHGVQTHDQRRGYNVHTVSGLYQLVASGWSRLPGWGWQAADGALSTIMGLLLLTQWPVSGLWAVGLFIGIDLIFYGSAWIVMALELHTL